jgi:hypothetical protein
MMAREFCPIRSTTLRTTISGCALTCFIAGAFAEAIDLAKNMVELPRHPNTTRSIARKTTRRTRRTAAVRCSVRSRLFDAFLGYELWPEMLALTDTFYLEPTDLPEEQGRRLYAMSLARFATGDPEGARSVLGSLDDCLKQLKKERYEATEKAEEKAKTTTPIQPTRWLKR